MQTKHITVGLKAAGDDKPEGRFTGYASVFGNKDSFGDVIVKGAFAESLASYGENGAGIPCYWSHQMSDPMMNIGHTVSAYEDEHGLKVDVQLDLDNPNGAYTHKLIQEKRVNQMSFAFDVEDFAFAQSEELGDYMELRKLKIHEVSVVQVGANQSTELLAVKERIAQLKNGPLSKSNVGQLREAISLIEDVLSSLDEPDDDDDGNDEYQDTDDEKSDKDSNNGLVDRKSTRLNSSHVSISYSNISKRDTISIPTRRSSDLKERIAQLKNGPLSKSNEGQLREAISLIEDVLTSVDEPDDDDDGNDEDQDTDDEKSVKDSGNGPVLPEHDGVVQDQAKSGGHPDVALANIYMIAMEGDLS